jgi:hypothetical protein
MGKGKINPEMMSRMQERMKYMNQIVDGMQKGNK